MEPAERRATRHSCRAARACAPRKASLKASTAVRRPCPPSLLAAHTAQQGVDEWNDRRAEVVTPDK
eukprot:365415-Chlamydomonas_euryale.AAC.10